MEVVSSSELPFYRCEIVSHVLNDGTKLIFKLVIDGRHANEGKIYLLTPTGFSLLFYNDEIPDLENVSCYGTCNAAEKDIMKNMIRMKNLITKIFV